MDVLNDFNAGKRLVLCRFRRALRLVWSMPKLAVKGALPKGNSHDTIILEGKSPVSHAATGSMGNLAPPIDYDSVSSHSSAARCGERLRT